MKVKSPAKPKKNFEYTSLPPVVAVGLSEKFKTHGYREQPLRLLIVGHNPSDQSYTKGHFYANPSNRMWHLLTKSSVVPTHFTAHDDDICPQQCGIGFTDLICGVSETKSNRFTDSEVRGHKTSLFQRIEAHMARAAEECGLSAPLCCPKVIAFSGVRQWKMLFPPNSPEFETRVFSSSSGSGRNTLQGFFSASSGGSQTVPRATSSFGVQTIRPPGWPKALSDSIVFVLPSSSGAAAMTNEERETPYMALGALLSEFEWPVSWPERKESNDEIVRSKEDDVKGGAGGE
jgi:TDG/mug DNA glycosylase family protein